MRRVALTLTSMAIAGFALAAPLTAAAGAQTVSDVISEGCVAAHDAWRASPGGLDLAEMVPPMGAPSVTEGVMGMVIAAHVFPVFHAMTQEADGNGMVLRDDASDKDVEQLAISTTFVECLTDLYGFDAAGEDQAFFSDMVRWSREALDNRAAGEQE